MQTYHANTGRLEREMITASLPSLQDPPMYRSGAQDGAVRPKTEAPDASPHVILPLLPHISREPTHRDFGADSNRADPGCIYSQGDAVYSNSAIVIARLAEIKQASTEPADLRKGEILSANSTANQDGVIESASDSSRSSKENGLLPVDAEVVAREGGVEAAGKEASDRSGRQPHPAALSPPTEAIPNWAEASAATSPSRRRW